MSEAPLRPPLERLQQVLSRFDALAVAVSGGVDSLTLAWAAAGVPGLSLQLVHAVSPAVPAEATQRVRDYAQRFGWSLQVIGAGEYDDPQYRANPVNRCYYCKTNLYGAIRHQTAVPIAAGTNLDDLGEYRPGLKAADEHDVRHPFVEAQIDKAAVRQIAAQAGLADIAQLPAQPCLASRVQTGIAIDANDLMFVHRAEQAVQAIVGAGDIRCRLTDDGVWIEAPSGLVDGHQSQISKQLDRLCTQTGRQFAGLRDYRRGSAFLTDQVASGE